MKSIPVQLALSLLACGFWGQTVAATEPVITEKRIIQSPGDYADTPWVRLRIPPGTKLSVMKSGKGMVLHRLEFAGGVTFYQEEDGTLVEDDHSGSGGVLCHWLTLKMSKTVVDRCYPGEKEVLRRLDTALTRVVHFIEGNSLHDQAREDEIYGIAQKLQSLPPQCSKAYQATAENVIAEMEKMSPAEFDTSIDRILSPARPPVFGYCP